MGEAVGVIVRSMRDNPNVVASFGREPGIRHKKLLRLFGAMAAAEVPGCDRDMLTALGPDGSILGVCGMMPPGRCQPELGRQLRLAHAFSRPAPGAPDARLRGSGPGRSAIPMSVTGIPGPWRWTPIFKA